MVFEGLQHHNLALLFDWFGFVKLDYLPAYQSAFYYNQAVCWAHKQYYRVNTLTINVT